MIKYLITVFLLFVLVPAYVYAQPQLNAKYHGVSVLSNTDEYSVQVESKLITLTKLGYKQTKAMFAKAPFSNVTVSFTDNDKIHKTLKFQTDRNGYGAASVYMFNYTANKFYDVKITVQYKELQQVFNTKFFLAQKLY